MFTKAKETFEIEVEIFARKNIISKLKEQGIDYLQLKKSDLNGLISDEIAILKSDSKKVGVGIGIGLALLSGI